MENTIKAKLIKRIKAEDEVTGNFYNAEEVLGHLTAFNDDHIEAVLALDDNDFSINLENALNIIDLNNEED